MRRILPALLFAGLALVPSAKADLFVYDVQYNDPSFINFHVKFGLPAFQQTVVNQTIFDLSTSSLGPVTGFSISGGPNGCLVNQGGEGGGSVPFGPCFVAGGLGFGIASPFAPAFNGPGTFSRTAGSSGITVTITDVPTAVPEPSAFVLLSSTLVAVGVVVRKRRFQRNRVSGFAGGQHYPS
jgi:hypothetical protein